MSEGKGPPVAEAEAAPKPGADDHDAQAVIPDQVGGAHTWKGLAIQPIAILAAVAVLAIWLSTADLSETELSTLAPGKLWTYTLEHLQLTFLAAFIVLLLAIPTGIVLTRGPVRFLAGPIIAIANIGQSAPAVGIIVLLAFWLDFTFQAAVVSLVIYAFLPVLKNTMLGLQQVDERLVEAGRGMGMSSTSVLLKIELPLAVPIMLSGVRTGLVLLVGTAALAAFINGGGLGLLIITGVNLYLNSVLVAGAVIIALLALFIDWLGRVVEHIATPKGL